MGPDINPMRAVLCVATAGISEGVIHTAQAVGRVVPFPSTCCGCPTNCHIQLLGGGNNIYHCIKCGSHCGHIGTIAWKFCHVCGKDVKFY